MRKICVSILAAISLSMSFAQPPTDTEVFQHGMFDLLKEFKGLDNDSYKKHFVTYDEFKAFSESHELQEYNQPMLDDMNSGDYYKEINKYYIKIKYAAAKRGVDWEKIYFLDFIYKTTSGGLKGELFFSYNDKTYSVKVGAYLLDSGYKVSSIKKFKDYNKKFLFKLN